MIIILDKKYLTDAGALKSIDELERTDFIPAVADVFLYADTVVFIQHLNKNDGIAGVDVKFLKHRTGSLSWHHYNNIEAIAQGMAFREVFTAISNWRFR